MTTSTTTAQPTPRYTVEAGRQILRDGVRVATVYSKVQTGEAGGLYPADADDFTHEVARVLNAYPALLAALEALMGEDHADCIARGGCPAYRRNREAAEAAIRQARGE